MDKEKFIEYIQSQGYGVLKEDEFSRDNVNIPVYDYDLYDPKPPRRLISFAASSNNYAMAQYLVSIGANGGDALPFAKTARMGQILLDVRAKCDFALLRYWFGEPCFYEMCRLFIDNGYVTPKRDCTEDNFFEIDRHTYCKEYYDQTVLPRIEKSRKALVATVILSKKKEFRGMKDVVIVVVKGMWRMKGDPTKVCGPRSALWE